MAQPRIPPNSALITAMVSAGAVSAQFIAGKATRDALFLNHLDVTSLPSMVVATAAFSILLLAVTSRGLIHVPAGVLVPGMFAVNAVLLLVNWVLAWSAPTIAAVTVYLLISGLGPMLGSGFWLIATDRFDPRTARQRFGQIAGVGTISGLAGALVAERVAALYTVETMLPVLALLNLVCAWQIQRLARSVAGSDRAGGIERAPELAPQSPKSGLRALAQTTYLQNLAGLILLGTIAAALADYVFKVKAVEAFGRGDSLLRFFAIYYAGTSLLAFLVQTMSSTIALERLGLALTASTPSLALIAGSIGGLVFPRLEGILIARGGESVFRGSLFRTGYEIFYTPIPSSEKRAAKSIIDVGCDRAGEALGGGLISLLLLLPIHQQYSAILIAALICSAFALVVARRLNQGYIQTLERSLLNRAVELELSDVEDMTTRTVVRHTLRSSRAMTEARKRSDTAPLSTGVPVVDPEVQEILALRSRNRSRIMAVLGTDQNIAGVLVPHAIPLLAWDPVAEDAVRALRKVAEEHIGTLIDALIDPNQPFAVRRRLARVFSVCVSQRAVDGLLLGLDDLRFEVRFQCGRSLAAIAEKNPRIRVEREHVFDVVRREVAVGRPVWESRRLLDAVEGPQQAFVDEFLKDRAGQSLAHVFTLLSLVLPSAPLQIAFRGLYTNDPALRGTSLEYLEGVLPRDIHERLAPFLGERPAARREIRAIDDVLADLLRSNHSILLNLEELRRRSEEGRGPLQPAETPAGRA